MKSTNTELKQGMAELPTEVRWCPSPPDLRFWAALQHASINERKREPNVLEVLF